MLAKEQIKIDKHGNENTALEESYSQISEEIKDKIEKRTVEFYRKHPDKIGDILTMLQEEAQRHLVTASIEAGKEPTSEERKKLEEVMALPLGKDREKALAPLLPLLSPEQHFTYDLLFSDDSLRTRLYLALGAYLNLLQEIAPDIFQQASDFIENCIADRNRLAVVWGEQLGIVSEKGENKKPVVLNITTQRAKKAIFGVSKAENLAFDPRENDALYNDPYPVNVWVGTLKKKKLKR